MRTSCKTVTTIGTTITNNKLSLRIPVHSSIVAGRNTLHTGCTLAPLYIKPERRDIFQIVYHRPHRTPHCAVSHNPPPHRNQQNNQQTNSKKENRPECCSVLKEAYGTIARSPHKPNHQCHRHNHHQHPHPKYRFPSPHPIPEHPSFRALSGSLSLCPHPCGSRVKSPKITQMAAPGRTRKQNGREKENRHKP
ncbi:hypothetical protein SDC9_83152 [bioreactor metagenome]|uniref:Uncharacterized protein n=1 Tax=bioreactor metagenome TaxID=1076179 RepID=A0A644ZCW4_9ZZZZ